MGASGLKVLLLHSNLNFLHLNKFIDRSSTVTYPSKGLALEIYTRSKPSHFYGAQNFIPFRRFVFDS